MGPNTWHTSHRNMSPQHFYLIQFVRTCTYSLYGNAKLSLKDIHTSITTLLYMYIYDNTCGL